MRSSHELLAPKKRGALDAENIGDADPSRPSLKADVRNLSSKIPLERIQANNRLNQAGADGVLAAVELIDKGVKQDITSIQATVEQIIEAIRFVTSSDLEMLEADDVDKLKGALAAALKYEQGEVRVQAARALQVHGPGAQRTPFLAAIGDSEKRVRWAVVRRFGDNPNELDSAQRSILLTYLESGTREEFELADKNNDESLSPDEFPPTLMKFEQLDADDNNSVSLKEWISPVPAEVRADVYALLLRLHGELTPDIEPAGYNPYLPSADQLDRVYLWREWNNQVSKDTDTDENEG